MKIITNQQLEQSLTYPALIDELEKAFQANYTVPLRHHHQYKNPTENQDSTLLLMPAWEAGKYLGVKLVTVSPNNSRYDLPAIQGIYTLFDAHKGMPLAQMDAKILTVRRTAAASALAARFLSKKESASLLMIGTGALSTHLIEAHVSVRPIRQVYVWGRRLEKAKAISEHFKTANFEVQAVSTIEEVMSKVDIISCATLSKTPLVFGKYLQAGQHVDLVGSYLPDSREADDEAIKKASIFVDTMEGASKESGDIVIPLKKGIIRKANILADLFGLCKNEHKGRQNETEITLFKSVGHAMEDLAAAKMVYENGRYA
jgi:ornithine cyclodeaminase